MTDKRWAQNGLRHNRNSAILSLAASHLLNSDATKQLLGEYILIKEEAIVFCPTAEDGKEFLYSVDLNDIVTEYVNNRERFLETLKEFYKSFRRTLVKESYEVVRAYSKANDLLNQLKAEHWYPFSRIVRNAISHDFHFNFTPHDKQILPVTYNQITIDISMDGTHMAENILTPGTTWKLFDEYNRFVERH